MMGWKILAAVAVLSAASTTTATAATPHWQVSTLPMPAGLENDLNRVVAHDGHGGFTAIVGAPSGEEVVTWKHGKPTEHGHPAGKQLIRVWGESRDDTLLVGTLDNKLFTMDGNGFHTVSTTQFSFVEWAVVGPDGDILIMADAADGSTSVQRSTMADPDTWQPVASATPNSEPVAVDDDGSLLMADPSGSYVLHDGVVHRLVSPSPTDAYQPQGVSIKHGEVVGIGWPTAQGDHDVLKWTAPDYAPQVLAGGTNANDVNRHGLVVGTADGLLPVAWPRSGAVEQLPMPTGIAYAVPMFVDDDGAVLGEASGPVNSNIKEAVVWRLVQS